MTELPEGVRAGKRVEGGDKWQKPPITATARFVDGPRDGETETIDLPAPDMIDGYGLVKELREIGTMDVTAYYVPE